MMPPTVCHDPPRCPDMEELRRLRVAIQASGEVIFMTDAEGTFTHVNPEFTRVYGYRADEVVGRATPRVLKSGTTGADDYARFWGCLKQGQIVRREFVNKAKDGSLLHIATSVSPIADDAGGVVGFLAVQRDVTTQRRLEKALEETARQYRALANAAADSIFIVDHTERIEYANAASAEQFGVQVDAILGRRIHDVFPQPIADEMWRELSAVFSTGTKQLFEHRFDLPTGEVWLEAWLVPVTTRGTQVQSVLGVARNITGRKQLERQLTQAQKMEAVGRLAGGIAHDFNNLLTVIMGYTELVQDRLRDAPDILADVEEIQKAGERASRLTRQLLAFSRKQPMRPQLVDVSAIVADAKKMVERVVGEDVELAVTFEPATLPVVADPGHIEQVLLNLVVNARDAMPKGGRLSVTTANVTIDEAAARKHADAVAGRYVRLTVQDTGCGMATDVLAHLFEPFFTTKPAGKGTGLGLSTVYGIVRQNGGWIAVESSPAQGTTISVFWPVDEGFRAIAPRVVEPTEAALTGTETILLVEDEPGIRSLMRRTLQARGYRVLDAMDVPDAVTIAETHPGPIDVLLTDIIMPVMNGPDLAQRVVKDRPAVKVLYVSGYPHQLTSERTQSPERISFLAKPFTPQALARRVRACLDGGDPPVGTPSRIATPASSAGAEAHPPDAHHAPHKPHTAI
jgi:two-component system, cell cycle sensor histidine kinase and response regulator CckA